MCYYHLLIIFLIIIFRECLLDVVQTSTLPLNEGDILQLSTLVFELYKPHPRLMTLVCEFWETSLSHLNQGEIRFAALPLSQLTLSNIRLTLGMNVKEYSILSLYHSLSNHHD